MMIKISQKVKCKKLLKQIGQIKLLKEKLKKNKTTFV